MKAPAKFQCMLPSCKITGCYFLRCSRRVHLLSHGCTERGASSARVSVSQTSDPSQLPDTLIELLPINCTAWPVARKKNPAAEMKKQFKESLGSVAAEKTERMGTDMRDGAGERGGEEWPEEIGWRKEGDRCKGRIAEERKRKIEII